ncbi:hypothetical protein PUR28_27915 [Streptomyces sp. BE308]|nr:hypothetical protein [Streptomyces sp. BE308]MEE1794555.1 hypothetical protein [Streptomyces sp. BE308]
MPGDANVFTVGAGAEGAEDAADGDSNDAAAANDTATAHRGLVRG